MKRLLGLAITSIALATPSAASAGTYDVHACIGSALGNGSWSPEVSNGWVTAYSACPGEGIVTRMSGGSGNAPYGASARQVFAAPPSTTIVRWRALVNQNSTRGWYAGIVDASPRWIWAGANWTTFNQYWAQDVSTRTSHLFAQVTCGDGNGCSRASSYGFIKMQNVVVTIEDNVPPSVAITGGLKSPSGWLRGDQDVPFVAADSTGLRGVEILVTDTQRGSRPGSCVSWSPMPCSDLAGTLRLRPADFPADGKHRIILRATDGGGNVSHAIRDVWVDNTPPTQPVDITLDGNVGWRSDNSFTVRWSNPRQSASAVSAVVYRLCPATEATKSQSCTQGTVRGKDVRSLPGLRMPGAGEWRLALWLQDAAGNADPERAGTISGLGLDDTPPELTFTPARDSDPARVRVAAKDATTRVGEAWIEARRRGESAWRSIPTMIESGGFSAVLDDEKLPKGRYDLRARARDLAGNERTIDRDPDGSSATRTLPLRLGTRLAVGHPRRVRARGSKGARRYRTILVMRPRARFGRTIPIRGRLTMPGNNPLASAKVEVWQRVKLPGAEWERIGQGRTSATGRFRFKALPGPSRLLRFRYPGTATIGARSTQVDVRVSAETSLKVTRRSVVNGEEVRFYGRLKGRQNGATGKLIHLQVYTRGRWSTFATPRAHRSSGVWRVPYRFTATRGRVTYRFRALVPRESTFPYETGASKSVRVSVSGL